MENKSKIVQMPDPRDRRLSKPEGGEKGRLLVFLEKRQLESKQTNGQEFTIENEAGADEAQLEKARKKVLEILERSGGGIEKAQLNRNASGTLTLYIKFKRDETRKGPISAHINLD